MQRIVKTFALPTLFLLSIQPAYAVFITGGNNSQIFPYGPRIALTGLTGDNSIGFGDAMIPVAGNCDGFFYTDVWGKFGNDNAWMGSVGAGMRQVISSSNILGGYVFLDRNTTEDKNHFWVISPGLESLGNFFDARINGYFPVGSRRVFAHSSFGDDIGIADDVHFQGHQEFDRLYNFYESVGPGVDGEIGVIFPCFHRLALYGGGYYFDMPKASNITGVEGRLEYPFNQHITGIVTDSYDNLQHNTLLAGIRISLGGVNHHCLPFNIHQRLLDPISRNLGTLHTGSGIPSEQTRVSGLIKLERDNIWFFNSGTSSQNGDGSFEHPFSADQFSQSTVNQAGKNANFYFNSGNYVIQGESLPNAQIDLPGGDSIYGRRSDFKLPAIGNNRPTLLGEINLLEGNNTLDSIQLTNQITHPDSGDTSVTALDIENANNITLNNDIITAENNTLGDNNSEQDALAIKIQNSQLNINNSVINAKNSVSGNNNDNLLTLDIDIFNNNTINITNNSSLNASAKVGGDNQAYGFEFTANIAPDLLSNHGNPSQINWKGNNNILKIDNTQLNSTAEVQGNDLPGTNIGGETDSWNILLHDQNKLIIQNSDLNVKSILDGDNQTPGFGGNCARSIELHDNNNLAINNSTLNTTALIKGENYGWNESLGLLVVDTNTVEMNRVNLNIFSQIQKDNYDENNAMGIELLETGNTMTINDSQLQVTAKIEQNNYYENSALGINLTLFGDNQALTINNSQLNVDAIVKQDSASNYAEGLFINGDSTATINSSVVNVNAQVDGDNNGNNTALGFDFNNNSTLNVNSSLVNLESQVGGKNNGDNISTGFTIDQSSIATINSSDINIEAILHGENLGTNTALSNDGSGQLIVSPDSLITLITIPHYNPFIQDAKLNST